MQGKVKQKVPSEDKGESFRIYPKGPCSQLAYTLAPMYL